MSMTAIEHIENLNRYIKEYPSALPFEVADLELFKNDRTSLDAAIDYVIALFSKIGLGENFAPTMDGILLDACLEFLTDIRTEIYS